VEQKLLAEPAARQPLAIVVLMQTGGSAPRQFQNYQTFDRILNGLLGTLPDLKVARAGHRVGLVTFDSHIREIWNFPPREEGMQHAFLHPNSGDPGAAILDSLDFGLDMLQQQPRDFRRVLILLSQPRDDGSAVSAGTVVRHLAGSNTTVYSLTFPPSGHGRDRQPQRSGTLTSPTFQAATVAMNANPAAQAAFASGGECARIRNQEDLAQTLSVLGSDFASTYLLSFRPDPQTGGFHALETSIADKRKHYTVAARTVYWVEQQDGRLSQSAP
jgi:hypothetical protein